MRSEKACGCYKLLILGFKNSWVGSRVEIASIYETVYELEI